MSIVDIILGLKEEINRKSCLMMAIRSARHLTGRDIVTGKAEGILDMRTNVLMKDSVLTHWLEDEHFFSGIAMYLIAIDCIGCVFDNKDKNTNKKNGIGRALKLFSNLDDRNVDAIIDLRNTLAHNFGLATEAICGNGKSKKHKHKYKLSFSDDAEAIKLPEKEWNGDFDNKDECCSTVIGVFSFCNLAETIIADVYKCQELGNLNLCISESEAKSRFTITIE